MLYFALLLLPLLIPSTFVYILVSFIIVSVAEQVPCPSISLRLHIFIYIDQNSTLQGQNSDKPGRENVRLFHRRPHFRTHNLTGNTGAVNADIGVYSSLSFQTVLKIIAF